MLLSKCPLGRFLYHERCSFGGGVAAGALTPAEGSLSLEGAGFGAQGRKGAEINPSLALLCLSHQLGSAGAAVYRVCLQKHQLVEAAEGKSRNKSGWKNRGWMHALLAEVGQEAGGAGKGETATRGHG